MVSQPTRASSSAQEDCVLATGNVNFVSAGQFPYMATALPLHGRGFEPDTSTACQVNNLISPT